MRSDPCKRTKAAALLAALLAALTLPGCGSGDEGGGDAPDYRAALAKAPRPLAKLYADGDAVIGGGEKTYNRTLAGVRGYPVVVNNWASWCGPCREEFPYFQSQAAKRLDEVAFLGVDSEDTREAAETFLRDNPLPYPSVEAPERNDLQEWTGTELIGYPNTLFYDRRGELAHVRQGPYGSEAELAANIEKYAL